MTLYIAHVCLNSKLEPIQQGKDGKEKINHPDYCNVGFVDIDPSGSSQGEQCWKYCASCEAKGYPVIKRPPKKELSERQQQAIENLKRK